MTLQSLGNAKSGGRSEGLLRRAVAVGIGLLLAGGLGMPAWAAPGAAVAPGSAGSGGRIEPRAMRAVILVDESGSLDEAAVRREKEAAELLAFSALTPDSEIAVVGFGSSNGEPGQQAVERYCPLTPADPAKQQSLVSCIDQIHRRSPSEGDDTDHVAALSEALSILGPAQEDSASVIFLLTDGRLDVAKSPQYGRPDARNKEAARQLKEQIAKARANNVQIWPLGFGEADKAALDAFAAGGAQQTCGDLPEYQPKARLASSLDEVTRSLFEAIGNANCARTTDFQTDTLAPGGTRELSVVIPEISTDGVLVAIKGDPRVRVAYIDPAGNDVTDKKKFDDSVFTRSTVNGTVESLRVQNPRPGTWKVRFTAPDDASAQQTVGAAAMWQGVLQASVGLNPPVPEPGQQAVISVRLQTRDGAIRNPRTLDGIRFGARVSGAGFDNHAVSLTDDGKGGDEKAGDAIFSGPLTVPPGASGNLTIRGTVSGPGVVGTSVNYQTVIYPGANPLTASVELDRGTVEPGGALAGTVRIDSAESSPRTFNLTLRDLGKGVLATVSPSTVASSGSGVTEHRFTVTFGKDSKQGPTGGQVALVDPAKPEATLAWAFIDAKVEEPPGLERFWWLFALLGVLLLGLLLLAARRAQVTRETGRVHDVTVHLWRGGVEVNQLRARRDTGSRFAFVVHDALGSFPRLDYAHGAPGYEVTRDRNGLLRLRTPAGEIHPLASGAPVPIEAGLAVSASVASTTNSPTPPPIVNHDDPYLSGGAGSRFGGGAQDATTVVGGIPGGGDGYGGGGGAGDLTEAATLQGGGPIPPLPVVAPEKPGGKPWRLKKSGQAAEPPPGFPPLPPSGLPPAPPTFDDLSN